MKARDRNGRIGPEAITDLFLLVGSEKTGGCKSPAQGPSNDDLGEILERLALTASCYVAARDKGPFPGSAVMAGIEGICAYLWRYPFSQINLRPVHAVPSDSDEIGRVFAFYRLLKEWILPFQEEGFRNQIVSRLRIFPILWFAQFPGLPGVRPLLRFLRENFFLPSLYLAPGQIQEWKSRIGRDGGKAPFERIYVGLSEDLEHDAILENLFVTSMTERFIEEGHREYISSRDATPCNQMLFIANGRSRGFCIKGSDPARMPGAQRTCSECVLAGLRAAAACFRENERTQEFGLLCDRAGSWLFHSGNHEAAMEAWQMVALDCPDRRASLEMLLGKALCHYARGELELAMECLRSARVQDPESAEIRYHMGLCEYGWRDYIEAADRFQEALLLGLSGSLRIEAEYMRGLSHYHIEEYDEALAALEKAVSGGKKDSPVYFYLGLSWLGKGQTEKALRHLLEALALGPAEEDLFHVLFYVAHAQKELGRYEEALETLKRAESIGQARKEVMNLAGFCLFKLGRYDEAIVCFRNCLEIDSRSAIDWANIGSCLRDKGDREGAIAMYRKALSLDPEIEFARKSLEVLSGGGGSR